MKRLKRKVTIFFLSSGSAVLPSFSIINPNQFPKPLSIATSDMSLNRPVQMPLKITSIYSSGNIFSGIVYDILVSFSANFR